MWFAVGESSVLTSTFSKHKHIETQWRRIKSSHSRTSTATVSSFEWWLLEQSCFAGDVFCTLGLQASAQKDETETHYAKKRASHQVKSDQPSAVMGRLGSAVTRRCWHGNDVKHGKHTNGRSCPFIVLWQFRQEIWTLESHNDRIRWFWCIKSNFADIFGGPYILG